MQNMGHMGWTTNLLLVFIVSNLVIAGHYTLLALRHFGTIRWAADTQIVHLQYGLFILSCGLGHYAMAGVMAAMLFGVSLIWLSPAEVLVYTHIITAMVSLWMEVSGHFGGRT